MTGTGPETDRKRNDLTIKTGKENGILAKMCTFSQKNEKFRKFLPKNEIKINYWVGLNGKLNDLNKCWTGMKIKFWHLVHPCNPPSTPSIIKRGGRTGNTNHVAKICYCQTK